MRISQQWSQYPAYNDFSVVAAAILVLQGRPRDQAQTRFHSGVVRHADDGYFALPLPLTAAGARERSYWFRHYAA